MTPNGQIGRWFYPALYFVFLFFSVILWLGAGSPERAPAAGGDSETAPVIQAEIVPMDHAARYIKARATHKRGGGSANWAVSTLRTYLSFLGRRCGGSTESELLACVPQTPAKGHLPRLAAFRGAELARRHGMAELANRLLLAADLSVNDPLSRKIFQVRLDAHRERGEFTIGRVLADLPGGVSGYEVSLSRARFYARLKEMALAKKEYLEAGRTARTRYQLRVAHRMFRRDFPSLFSTTGPDTRDLLLFAPSMDRSDVNELRGIPASEIIASTTPARVDGDAYFFLRTLQARYLPELAEKVYTHVYQNPDLLYGWLAQLGNDGNAQVAGALFQKFSHTRKAHAGIWRLYIDHLEKTGQSKQRFREVAGFLAVNHADYHMYDELMRHLIGPLAGSRAWASEADWQYALKAIPPRTTRGRLIFWYHEYLMARGRNAEAAAIRDDFYAMAPGSYYAHAFWDRRRAAGEDGDYRQAWDKVKSRADYLKWVGRYGGNDEALAFLAGKRTAKFHDPDAVKLWDGVRAPRFSVPAAVYDLYRLGEYALAQEFFSDAFSGKLSEVEILARYSDVGRRTGILYLAVFFTRQLTRARNVPEDPFSMPEGLLKTLYPRPYLDLAKKHATFYNIDPNMIYALMRQESMFKEAAISRSNARGLMQVMPATGRWLARRLRLRSYDLHEPDTSIRFGSMFFADMLKANEGDFRWAAIAYNGGPGNLRKWKRRFYRGDLNQFLEFIPVAESRDYCRITYRNYQHYRATYALYPD